ncbi:MAG: hypothetical protein R2736_08455 [Solirubrobacterales bacterium]
MQALSQLSYSPRSAQSSEVVVKHRQSGHVVGGPEDAAVETAAGERDGVNPD